MNINGIREKVRGIQNLVRSNVAPSAPPFIVCIPRACDGLVEGVTVMLLENGVSRILSGPEGLLWYALSGERDVCREAVRDAWAEIRARRCIRFTENGKPVELADEPGMEWIQDLLTKRSDR